MKYESMKELSLDKSNWKPVKFGDVVFEPKESVKDILADGIEHVVGLEHIDSEDIHLRRSGSVDNGTTFTKKFSPGDVLFGRRRAYLKKAAQANLEGICSGDIIVMRAKDTSVTDLLPYIVCNDGFFDYAIQHSAGGLSPRVKFKDLANYEFLLPPPEYRPELSKLLSSLEKSVESNARLREKCSQLKNSYMKKFSSGGEGWLPLKIKDLMHFEYGKALKESDRNGGSYPVVSSSGVQGFHDAYLVPGPGIVVGRKGNVGEVTWVDGDFWPIDTSYYVVINERYSHLPKKLFFYLLKSVNFKKFSIATAVPGLNRDDAHYSDVYFPEEDLIEDILEEINLIESTGLDVEKKFVASKKMMKSLVNQVF